MTIPGAVLFPTCCGLWSESLHLFSFGSCQKAKHIFHGPLFLGGGISPQASLGTCLQSCIWVRMTGWQHSLPSFGCLLKILFPPKTGNCIFSLIIKVTRVDWENVSSTEVQKTKVTQKNITANIWCVFFRLDSVHAHIKPVTRDSYRIHRSVFRFSLSTYLVLLAHLK